MSRGGNHLIRNTLCGAVVALAGLASAQAAVPRVSGAAMPHRENRGIEHAQLVGALRLKGQLFHVQGVVVEDARIWVTSVDKRHRRGYLHEFDRASGRFLRRIDLTDGVRYHPGGISITGRPNNGRSIWVPVAEMKADSSAVLVEIDADSLAVRRTIPVADHIGCVAASPTMLIAGNWDSKLLYVFDLSDGAPVRTVPNPSTTHFQDMKLIGGQLVASGSLSRSGGAIDWIDWPSLKLTRTLRSGNTRRTQFLGRTKPYTAEGMSLEGRELYLVPQDGPSRMFHFRLDS